MRIQHKYTDEDVDYIKANIDVLSYKQMAEHFTQKYGHRFSYMAISKYATTHNIVKTCRVFYGEPRKIKFDELSEEKINFIKDNFPKFKKYKELANCYSEKWGVECSRDVMNTLCSKMGLHYENAGGFQRGGRTYNKQPIGTERIGSGYKVCIKVKDDKLPSGKSSNWMPKNRYIYEQHFGSIGADDVVIHLDGDTNNFDIDNLYCVNRRLTGPLANRKWWGLDREAKIAAIKLIELELSLKESEE